MICEWFDGARGAALGVMGGVGNGVGAAVLPLIAVQLLGRFGWRGAWVGDALVVFGFGFPIMAVLLRDAGKTAGPAKDAAPVLDEGLSPGQAMRTGLFWLILVAIALGAGCVTAFFVHVVPLLTDRGFDVRLATNVLVTFALVTSAWQVVVGAILDRTGSPRVVATMYLSAIAGLILVTFARTPPFLLAGGAFLGIGLGAPSSARCPISSRATSASRPSGPSPG